MIGDQFEAKATNWLPIKKHEKTKELLFPLEDDWEYVWQSYCKVMIGTCFKWSGETIFLETVGILESPERLC